MTRLENVKELLRTIKKADYKDLFMALCLNEKCDYMGEIDDISNKDLEFLDGVYSKMMENDSITGLLNEQVMDIINGESDNDEEEDAE